MATEIITPDSHEAWLELRKRDITSTDVAALFSASPYLTLFELWHRKAGTLDAEFSANERMTWGSRLESAIAHGVAEDRGWEVRPLKDYIRDPDARAGASFDFMRTDGKDGPELVEVKNVDWLAYRNDWIKGDEDADPEAPVHIELQVQHQLMVSGFKRAHICALVGGNQAVVITRERDEAVILEIRKAIAKFWKSVADRKEPDPVMPADVAPLLRLNAHAEPGKFLDLSDNTEALGAAQEYQEASAWASQAEERKQLAKLRMFQLAGDAEKFKVGEFTVSCGAILDTPPTIITQDVVGQTYGGRKGYRMLRLTRKK